MRTTAFHEAMAQAMTVNTEDAKEGIAALLNEARSFIQGPLGPSRGWSEQREASPMAIKTTRKLC